MKFEGHEGFGREGMFDGRGELRREAEAWVIVGPSEDEDDGFGAVAQKFEAAADQLGARSSALMFGEHGHGR